MSDVPYPNVRARLRRTRSAPGTAIMRTTMTIYLRDRRFRVVDEAGRAYAPIVADVSAPRGFGATPQTIEHLMDEFHDSQRTDARPPTILRGDLATGVATVSEAGGEPWPVDPDRVAPVAEQILLGEATTFEPVGTSSVLGRPCTEYRGSLDGEEAGYTFHSNVRLLVSEPFVLVREVVDSAHADLSARTEVLELDEGVVTDAEL